MRRIDPALSIEWLNPPGRFAILHREQLAGRPDEVIDRTARELQQEAATRGYMLDFAECQFSAAQAFRDSTVVFYVTEEDGSYRAPDGRDLVKLHRMDWNRRNLGLHDWQTMVRAKADVLREQRERDAGDVWECIRRDRAFARVASDILWGLKPMRPVYLKEQEIRHAGDALRQEAPDGAAPSPGAGHQRDDGVPLPGPDPEPPAPGSRDAA